jgi:hypothetical protein
MAQRFTPTEDTALRALLGASSPTPLPYQEVQRVLSLPDLPHLDLLGDDTWLIGGRLVRWLTREPGGGGDYDLFCASLEALERTARRMWAQGYKPCRRYVAPTFGAWVVDRLKRRDDHARCMEAPPDTEAARQEKLRLRRFPDGREMYALELHSPEGRQFQLVHIPALFEEGGDARQRQLAFTDLSICQFLLDGRHLYAGPHAWEDLLRNRVRVVHMVRPRLTAERMARYAYRGFWPYTDSVREVAQAIRRHGSRPQSARGV